MLRLTRLALFLSLCAALACGEDSSPTGKGGAGGGSSGTGGSSSGTGGGVGGSGFSCVPGSVVSCYEGPDGTEGVGVCEAGTGVCNQDGDAVVSCDDQTLPVVEVCGSAGDDDCNAVANDHCAGWSKFIDAGFYNVWDVAVGPEDVVLIAGNANSTVNFGSNQVDCIDTGGYRQAFVAKLDNVGDYLWAWCAGADDTGQVATGVAVDSSGNVFVSGFFYGGIDLGGGEVAAQGDVDGFLVKMSPTGVPMWNKILGEPDQTQYGDAVRVDPDDNLIFAGVFTGSVNLGTNLTSAGFQDVVVVKASTDGTQIWAQQFGSGGSEIAPHLAIAPDGDIIIALITYGTLNLTGEPLSDPGSGIVVARLQGSDGAPIWATVVGGAGIQSPTGVAVNDTHVALVGTFEAEIDLGDGIVSAAGVEDMFVAELDATTGEVTWGKTFGAQSGTQNPRSVAVDAQGRITVAGGMQETIDFGGGPISESTTDPTWFSAVLFQLDVAGDHLWSRGFGDESHAMFGALAPNSLGGVVVAGETWGYVDLGNGSLGPGGFIVGSFPP